MKKQSTFFVMAIVMLAFSANTFAQVTATATSAATIVTPITITKTADMLFGNIAVSPVLSGTVILDPAGVRTTGGGGGVTLPSTTGTFNSAAFTVTGVSGYTYSVTLPNDGDVLMTGPGPDMPVDGFVSNSTGTLTAASFTLNVGATLSVAAAQTAGAYSSAPFPVTINYN